MRSITKDSFDSAHDFSFAGSGEFAGDQPPKDGAVRGFEQVALDYVWMPKRFLSERTGGTNGLARLLQNLTSLLCKGGAVFLPFQVDLLVSLSSSEALWTEDYTFDYIRERDRNSG
jgi:hypothetical protein